MNEAVETLTDVYREGDKSVLPTLLRFPYLTDFYGDALLGDRDGFLQEVSRLKVPEQQAVASGLAGQWMGLRTKERVDGLVRVLSDVPQSSPQFITASRLRITLLHANAALYAEYFPPEMFASGSAISRVRWYARSLHTLGEDPLWPPKPGRPSTYRLTVFASFVPPKSVTLIVMPDGSGKLTLRLPASDPIEPAHVTEQPLDSRVTGELLRRIGAIGFWELPTEKQSFGLDGADFLLEGTEGSRYHAVDRWCPQDEPFGRVAQDFLDLAKAPKGGMC